MGWKDCFSVFVFKLCVGKYRICSNRSPLQNQRCETRMCTFESHGQFCFKNIESVIGLTSKRFSATNSTGKEFTIKSKQCTNFLLARTAHKQQNMSITWFQDKELQQNNPCKNAVWFVNVSLHLENACKQLHAVEMV